MKNTKINKIIILIAVTFIVSSSMSVFGATTRQTKPETIIKTSNSNIEHIQLIFDFSNPTIEMHETIVNDTVQEYAIVRVQETNHNQMVLFNMDPTKPVLPVNTSIFNLPFGSKILNVTIKHTIPEIIYLPVKIAYCKASYDSINIQNTLDVMDASIYGSNDPYPGDWVSYRTGGGLNGEEHVTFLVFRTYPIRYFPLDDQLQYINHIQVNITYETPAQPILQDNDRYDLLILAPGEFTKHLIPLVHHKNQMGVKTRIVSLCEVYNEMYWHGRDFQEKIKYYIKHAIENWGITHVLLVGGIKGQTYRWNFPVRYSYVVPPEEQEYAEQKFITDLYYADIYNSDGSFSSWDSNNDNQFSVWNSSFQEEMDLYPDVYLGRLPCRSIFELKIMVDKLINYEKTKADPSWFNNLILVAGDSYPEDNGFNEGELISERAIELMPDFNPIRVYARNENGTKNDINRETVNNAMMQGAGFAYFCGHGSAASWSTHFPPDGKNWTTGYDVFDMMYLRNKEKLPVTVVGGCHNGEYDVTMARILTGFLQDGIKYFRLKPTAGQFWYREWIPNCWAWWLVSKHNGGAISCIANTGLGTHGDDDVDNNSVADYLEALDGWLELKFLELYGTNNMDILGENHGQTITEYMHRFLGDEAVMDIKMVQQWQLFGDPSMKIGGYE